MENLEEAIRYLESKSFRVTYENTMQGNVPIRLYTVSSNWLDAWDNLTEEQLYWFAQGVEAGR